MQIWMTSSTCNAEHAALFEMARQVIEPAFNERFERADYGKGLVELQYRALLHAPGKPAFGEVKKYSRALHAAEVVSKLEIPHACTRSDMLARAAISVARTFERLRRSQIPAFDLDRFAQDYAQFAVTQGWLTKQAGAGPKLYVVGRGTAADRVQWGQACRVEP